MTAEEKGPFLQHHATLAEDVAVQRRLLLSQLATKLGRKAWFFCAPFFLMWFSPGTLLGPGLFGMISFGARLLMGPKLGTWADGRDRLEVVRIGIILQALAAIGNVMLILATSQLSLTEGYCRVPCLCLACFLGVVEKLSFPLMDMPVKRDWVPTLLMHDKDLLEETNLRMSQIDMGTVVVSPIIAGLALELPALCGGDSFGMPTVIADTVGYLVVGLLYASSSLPQYLLLRQVYQLRREKLARAVAGAAQNEKSRESCSRGSAWRTWFLHPFGLPWLSMSYALLFFTVLSPQGALFTAYLAQAGMPTIHLSWMRGAGALAGLLGVGVRPRFLLLLSERLLNALAVGSVAVFMILASVFLQLQGTARSHLDARAGVYLYLCAACVVLGRPGLMSFELGVLNQAQLLVDEGNRAAVGAVDDALQSGFTLGVYGLNTIFNKPQHFGGLVSLSSIAVSSGCLAYIAWCSLYQEQRHRHDQSSSSSEGDGLGEVARWHGHTHSEHPHTKQAERDIDKDGWHSHLVFDPFWRRA